MVKKIMMWHAWTVWNLNALYVLRIYKGYNLTIFNGVSNDNEIIWNFNDYQSINKRTYIKTFLF
jgi:hypothetical protein